ncbi:4952_t:CDS:1 [Dentiscutata heterogama]|uniref:4952_t:CDS:1 n=1 Tax=Dentiscutata heterogama TaxID=1316150 RepID=A0ACA9L1E1_9GLOM|nr:4952_t:CDS:1 [Dentiscutata heterogama]
MQITVLYFSQSARFNKYLGPLGSNIKLNNTYLVSGFFKFSTSGKMMLVATDIDYIKVSDINNIKSEITSSSTSNTRSIIDIIAEDIESINLSNKQDFNTTLESSNTLTDNIDDDMIPNLSRERKKPYSQVDHIDLDEQAEESEKQTEHEEDINSQDDSKDQEENFQPKKRKKVPEVRKEKKKLDENV